MAVTAACFCIAYILHRLVENQFRNRSFLLTRWRMFFGLFCFMVFACFLILISNGLPDRYPKKTSNALKYLTNKYDAYTWGNFVKHYEYVDQGYEGQNKPLIKKMGDFSPNKIGVKVLVIGDSQAGDFVNVLKEVKGVNMQIRGIPISAGCQAIVLPIELYSNLDAYTKYVKKHTKIAKQNIPYCRIQHRHLLHSKAIKSADVVIFAAHYYNWSAKHLDRTTHFIKKRNDKANVFYLELKNQKYLTGKLLQRFRKRNLLDEHSQEFNEILRKTIPKNNIISMNDVYCKIDGTCDLLTKNGFPIFFDTIHFTPAGVKYVANSEIFSELVERIYPEIKK